MSEPERDDEDRGFIGRWSSLKRRARTPTPPPAEPPPDAGARAPALSEEEVARLPDPDSLGPGADFKVFLREGVPEALKRKALRRLWRVNPLLGALDGLNDYDLDYTDAATVVANLQTLYRAGRGMVEPEGETAAPAAASDERAPASPAGAEPAREPADGTAAEAPAAPSTAADEPSASPPADEPGPPRPEGQSVPPPSPAPPAVRRPAAVRRWSLSRT